MPGAKDLPASNKPKDEKTGTVGPVMSGSGSSSGGMSSGVAAGSSSPTGSGTVGAVFGTSSASSGGMQPGVAGSIPAQVNPKTGAVSGGNSSSGAAGVGPAFGGSPTSGPVTGMMPGIGGTIPVQINPKTGGPAGQGAITTPADNGGMGPNYSGPLPGHTPPGTGAIGPVLKVPTAPIPGSRASTLQPGQGMDEYQDAAQRALDSKKKTPSSGGGGGNGGGGGGSYTPVVVPPHYTLIRGDGPNNGNVDDFKGNGAAVYIVNDRGERFHVTEKLMNEMIADGSWYEPEEKPQSVIDGMAMRYTVDSTDSLKDINNATVGVGGWMLIRGNGGPLDNNTLVGNGNAVYAVDNQGNKFHVTEAGMNELTAENGGAAPTVNLVTQAAADTGSVDGALVNTSGVIATTVDPIMDNALKSVPAILGNPTPINTEPVAGVSYGIVTRPPAAEPAPAVAVAAPPAPPAPPADEALGVSNSAESTLQFRLVRGNGPNTGDTVNLKGNGAAVYAVNASNQKVHVTGDLYNAMVANGIWKEPEVIDQGTVDAIPNAVSTASGSAADINTVDQLAVINIGNGTEFRLIEGNGANTGNVNDLTGNGAAVYALTADGSRYHITAELAAKLQASGAYAAPEILSQSEVDGMGPMKGHLTTVAQLNTAVKNPAALGAGGYVTDSAMPAGAPGIVAFTPNQ